MMEYEQPEFKPQGFADQLNIETPEQVDLRFPIAGLGSRFVAVLIDHLIQLVPYVLFFLALLIFGSSLKAPRAPVVNDAETDLFTKWFIAFLVFLNFCWYAGYFALFEAFRQGQTPGKKFMKLRVIKDSGRQITLFEALARNLLRVVDLFPSLYLAGVITMLCNKKNKRIGDFAAGTMVVHEIPTDDRSSGTFLSSEDYFAPREAREAEPAPPADAVARLDANDLHVIETFFARALDLDPTVRTAMAARIAERMAAKMQVRLPEGNPERSLEMIVKIMRSTSRRF